MNLSPATIYFIYITFQLYCQYTYAKKNEADRTLISECFISLELYFAVMGKLQKEKKKI